MVGPASLILLYVAREATNAPDTVVLSLSSFALRLLFCLLSPKKSDDKQINIPVGQAERRNGDLFSTSAGDEARLQNLGGRGRAMPWIGWRDGGLAGCKVKQLRSSVVAVPTAADAIAAIRLVV